MGAIASKKASALASSRRAIAPASASEVSGPVATMPADSRPGALAAREPASHDHRPQLATDSAGAASSTVISCPHLRHLREIPLVLVCFSSIPTNPQLGQGTATGRFQVE